MATPVDNEKLREEIRMLGALLGEVVSEQRGPAALELIESVRHHARDRRRAGGDATRKAAENALTESIRALDETDIATVIRAFSIFFDLANLAEDRHRVRILRERERSRPGEWRAESLGAAVHELRRRSVPSAEIADLLSKLHIEPVFTAHPTEAKRRSVREKVRRLRHVLTDWDQRGDLLPAEVARIQLRLKCEIKALWQTDFHRPTRPRVREEVQRGLSFADTLWEVAPQLRSDLRAAVAREYPDLHSSDRPTLTFGSWIGGDRDGHDGVTADVTADTLLQLRLAALSHHRTKADELERILSMSIQQTGVHQPLADAVHQALGRWRVLRNRQKYISEFELFRRWLNVVDWRLEQTAAVRFGARSDEIDAEPPEGAYASTEELLADVQLMVDALEATGADDVAAVSVRTWLDQISAFGLHFAKLDVRQESGRHERTIAEAMRLLGVEADYSGLSEADPRRLSGPDVGDDFRSGRGHGDRGAARRDAAVGPGARPGGADAGAGRHRRLRHQHDACGERRARSAVAVGMGEAPRSVAERQAGRSPSADHSALRDDRRPPPGAGDAQRDARRRGLPSLSARPAPDHHGRLFRQHQGRRLPSPRPGNSTARSGRSPRRRRQRASGW